MTDAKAVYRHHPTQAEIDAVLSQRLVATIGTVNEDGSVHLAYVIFAFADRRFLVETSSITRKARNVRARGQATVLVQGTGPEGRNLMVSAEGAARLLEGDDGRRAIGRVRAKYVKADALDGLARAWDPIDDVAIEVTPQRWRSWTGSLLHAAAIEQLGDRYEEIWLEDE